MSQTDKVNGEGKLQEALELEKEKKEIISSLFDDWIYEYDIKEDRIVTISGSNRAYGMERQQNPSVSYLCLDDLHPEDREAFERCCKGAVNEPQCYAEARVLVGDEYRWISLTTKMLTDKKGEAHSIIGKVTDIDEKKKEELRLKEKAMRDAMTGLLNRTAFQEQAELFIDRLIEDGTGNPVMLMIDLDRVKQINDRFGHLYGDTIIMGMTHVLSKLFAEDGIIGRFGGDEFTVLLPHLDREKLTDQIAQMKELLRSEVTQDEMRKQITCSIGIAAFGQDGTTVEELIQNADNALYYVKENGRNSYAFCTEEIKRRFSEEYRIKYAEQPIEDNTRVAQEITEYALELLEGTSELKHAVNVLLMKTGKRFGLSCVSIREYDRERPRISFLWKEEDKFTIRKAQNVYLTREEWKEIREQYQQNRIIEISDSEELPKESALYRTYQANQIRALLQCPLLSEGKIFGYISYVDTKPREWSEEEKHPLIMLSRLIGNYLAREKAYQRIQQKVELLKSFDDVTGLLKFDKFKEVAQAVLDQKNPAVQYGLVSVDFAHFKYFNEVYGFREGDEVLRDFAELVAKHNPRAVAACRDYADNFIIMVTVQSPEALLHNIETYNQTFIANQNQKFTDSKLELCCGAYIITDPENGIIQAIDNANMARKAVKERQSEGSIRMFEPSMKVNRLREIALLHMLEEAIQNEEFQMYLQPKISLKTGELVGAEALARWIKPDGSMIMPSEFIPALESSGKIVELDLYMYEQLLKQMRIWINREYPVVPVSVNLSRYHFKNEKILETLLEVKERYKIEADQIEFEITESAFFADQKRLIHTMKQIKKAGFQVSIDDFGTGYSSLGMLTELSADIVKLDKEFLRNRDSEVTRAMLTNVIRLIKDNRMSVLCEGIETEDQAKFLSEAGCDIGQGYYFSKPMSARDFEEKYFGGK